MNYRLLACTLAIMALGILPCAGYGAEEPPVGALQILTTPAGQRFGIIGKKGPKPAPTLFVFAVFSGATTIASSILMTAMLVSFGLLVNERILLADHSSHWNWTESAVNLAVIGSAWVVADSLARTNNGASEVRATDAAGNLHQES